jgi:redox-regulated HSP33 family molecular chaperone
MIKKVGNILTFEIGKMNNKNISMINTIKFKFSKLKPYGTNRDHLLSGFFNDGTARFVFSDISNILSDCRKRFDLYEFENLKYLSIAYNTTILMNSFLQGEERVKLSSQFSDYIDRDRILVKNLYSESISTGEVRGYIEETVVKESEFEGSIDDYLKISKILYNQKSENSSMIRLKENKLTEIDIYRYFEESEQIKTFLNFETSYREEIDRMFSHGFIIQKMPDFDEGLLKERFDNIISNDIYNDICKGNLCVLKIEELFKELNFDVTISNRTPIDFFCRCSLETFKSLLKSFSIEDILDMHKKNQNTLKCRTCNTQYKLSGKDFTDIMDSINHQN